MSKPAPVVYLLHGEDEYGMSQFVLAMQEKLGDPSTAEMNMTRLAGSYGLDEVRGAAQAMPFLADRRVVVLEDLGRKFKRKEDQEKFTALCEDLPQTTALVLVESKTLKESNWLVKWAKAAGDKAYIRAYTVPKGPQLAKWVQAYTKEQGGEIDFQAASLLAETCGDEPRAAALEVEKLLAYVNYARPVDVADVDELAAFGGKQGDFFQLIDSLAAGDGRKAMDMLKRLLDEQDALPLFFSLVGHFRLLLQTREVYEKGGVEGTVASELGIHPYRAKKLYAQAKTLSLGSLEHIYRRLQDYDYQIKTGQIEGELALETLVAGLTIS